LRNFILKNENSTISSEYIVNELKSMSRRNLSKRKQLKMSLKLNFTDWFENQTFKYEVKYP